MIENIFLYVFKRCLGFVFVFTFCSVILSQCPPFNTNRDHLAKDSTAHYDTSQITDPGIAAAVESAFNAWTAANQTNGTGVTFERSTTEDPMINFIFGGASGTRAAISSRTSDHITHVITYGTIHYYTAGECSTGWIYDQEQSGYYEMFYEATLHEIGHFMGLGDVPPESQAAQQSVMNSYIGTNDSGHHYADHVTDCDNNKLKATDSPYIGLGGGSGNGGDPGGSAGNCTPMYWVIYCYLQSEDIPLGEIEYIDEIVYVGCY